MRKRTLEVRYIKPVTPPRANRKTPRECDFALYCERNLALNRVRGQSLERWPPAAYALDCLECGFSEVRMQDPAQTSIGP